MFEVTMRGIVPHETLGLARNHARLSLSVEESTCMFRHRYNFKCI